MAPYTVTWHQPIQSALALRSCCAIGLHLRYFQFSLFQRNLLVLFNFLYFFIFYATILVMYWQIWASKNIIICYFSGVSYLDFPGNILMQRVPVNKVIRTAICPEPPLAWPDPALVSQAAKLIMAAKRPLVIVGKGIYNIISLSASLNTCSPNKNNISIPIYKIM